MFKDLLFTGVILVLASNAVEAYDCCSAYTDLFGKYHESVLCEDYCCWDIGLSGYKTCCSVSWRQVPASDRDNESCVKSWISEHIWVPIVGGIAGLLIIIGIIVCCCCCCGCCRR